MQGAFVGSITALSVMTWICFRAQQAIATGELKFDTKAISTSGCTYHFMAGEAMNMLGINETISAQQSSAITESHDDEFHIHHISYLWYTLVGCSICIIVALITSFTLGCNNPADLDSNLLAPFVRKIINKSSGERKKIQRNAIEIESRL
jgi:hypothetical protein